MFFADPSVSKKLPSGAKPVEGGLSQSWGARMKPNRTRGLAAAVAIIAAGFLAAVSVQVPLPKPCSADTRAQRTDADADTAKRAQRTDAGVSV